MYLRISVFLASLAFKGSHHSALGRQSRRFGICKKRNWCLGQYYLVLGSCKCMCLDKAEDRVVGAHRKILPCREHLQDRSEYT